ncbi:MAG: HAD family hydrolase [Neomegalonema sp.]|nr:HAD family hydrolase [Neomegalonema sp.]
MGLSSADLDYSSRYSPRSARPRSKPAPSPQVQSLKDKRLVLACDLDGCLLAGTAPEREALYWWIERNRDQVGLVMLSDRTASEVEEMLDAPDSAAGGCKLPWPDLLIAEVGTSVAEYWERQPDSVWKLPKLRASIAFEGPIIERWRAPLGASPERALLSLADGVAGLRKADGTYRHHLRFCYDAEVFDGGVIEHFEAYGFDVLLSQGKYIDVLPQGISKGPTLRRVLENLEVRADRVIVAGAGITDLSALQGPYRGIATANADEDLLSKMSGRVFRTQAAGCAGVEEAIEKLAPLI